MMNDGELAIPEERLPNATLYITGPTRIAVGTDP